MKDVFGMLLIAVGIIASPAAVAQTTQPTSDLRQLVEAMQKVAKPTAGQERPLVYPTNGETRMVTINTLPERPMLLFINDRHVPFDSLNIYTLDDAELITLNKDDSYTSLFGSSGSWGVIQVKLKPKKQQASPKR